MCLALCAGASRGHWTLISHPVTTPLRAVRALPNGLAWVAGDAGVVYGTTDSGTTWYRQTTRFQNGLLSIDFASAAVGCVSGQNGDSARTTDGGAYWTHMVVPGDDLGIGPPDSVAPILSPDETNTWALARWNDATVLYHSTSGGVSWELVPHTNHGYASPNTVYGMCLTSSSEGWLASGRISGAQYIPVLLRTIDAGLTWQAFDAPATPVNSPSNPAWQVAIKAVSPSRVLAQYWDATRSVGSLFHLARNAATGAWSWSSWPWVARVQSIAVSGQSGAILVGDATWETRNGFTTVHRTENPGGLAMAADFLTTGAGYGVAPDGSIYRWTPNRAGDVNMDGVVDLVDACRIAVMVSEGTPVTADRLWVADVTGEGQITLADAAAALRLAGGLAA
jgi:hypothetical protein